MAAKRKQAAARKTPRVRFNLRVLVHGMLATAVIAGAAATGQWLIQPTTLPISAVRVEGSFKHLTPRDVQAVLADKTSGGFFELNVERVKHTAERLPWVKHASVRRIWPDTLLIEVTEQKPVAHWNGEALLNAYGEVFRPQHTEGLARLPRLGGPDGSEEEVMQRYQNLAQQMSRLGLHVAELSLSDRRAWQLELVNGTRIQLGRDSDHDAVQRLLAAYPAALREQMDRIDEIDLRYTNGFAVRWNSQPNQSAETNTERVSNG